MDGLICVTAHPSEDVKCVIADQIAMIPNIDVRDTLDAVRAGST